LESGPQALWHDRSYVPAAQVANSNRRWVPGHGPGWCAEWGKSRVELNKCWAVADSVRDWARVKGGGEFIEKVG
jgi:hypothetical protein